MPSVCWRFLSTDWQPMTRMPSLSPAAGMNGAGQTVSLTGFFPEFYVPGYRTCETDTISDMLGLAVKMSAAGVADYWDDVDRWVRNQFTEQQLTSTDWIQKAAARSPHKELKPNETADKVAERNIGGF